MRTQLLVTTVGEDKPGIVAKLTEVFVKHGANLEESRMAILGGEFAAIALVTLERENLDDLKKALEGLKSEGLTVSTKGTSIADRLKDYTTYELELRGADHEGIVHKVSSYLRDRNINIQSIDTQIINAPETGSPLFCMKAIMQVPPRITFDELRKNLDAIGDAEMVDIELSSKVAVVVA